MKKILVQLSCSFLIMVIGFIFSEMLVAFVSRNNPDQAITLITFLILFLIWIVGFFSLRIIYLLKSRNTTFEKKTEKIFFEFEYIFYEYNMGKQQCLPVSFLLATDSFFALSTSRGRVCVSSRYHSARRALCRE